jgi:hypothetical protein
MSRVELRFYASLATAVDRGEWSLHTPAALSPGTDPAGPTE